MSDLSGVQGRNRLPLFERNCGRFDVPDELELTCNKTEKILLLASSANLRHNFLLVFHRGVGVVSAARALVGHLYFG